MPGCKTVFRADNEDGILSQVADHARRDHGLEEGSPELVSAVRRNIVTVS